MFMQDLYKWGARKFVVFDICPLGCLPGILNMLPVKPHTRCAEQINDVISIYNMKLGAKLKQLSSMLKGLTFITGNTYNLTQEILQNPGRYGIKETRKSCCDPCMPNGIPCQDRNSYQFWDSAHPTQAIHKIFASECFSGTALCTPMNIAELVHKK
ncbi:hypothetical protein F0562_023328 [Nyssa sinensis]|uniref:GDSL esterase/lipase n=1 Tax=Nyssa sinensis TaxID=561372 RepID=A0A5J5BHQ5_9ASTE|nr:hypothetical protein F0562_023328 [Nyssa sinensis]